MLPSVNHGFTFLDISAYYLSWYKVGAAPVITRDTIYLTHRKQVISAPIAFPQSLKMTQVMGSTAPRNNVEVLSFSQGPGTVQVQVGSKSYTCAVDAGIDTCTVPLGAVSAKLLRDGTATASLTSPYPVSSTPYVHDFQYVSSSTGRQGATVEDGKTTTAAR